MKRETIFGMVVVIPLAAIVASCLGGCVNGVADGTEEFAPLGDAVCPDAGDGGDAAPCHFAATLPAHLSP